MICHRHWIAILLAGAAPVEISRAQNPTPPSGVPGSSASSTSALGSAPPEAAAGSTSGGATSAFGTPPSGSAGSTGAEPEKPPAAPAENATEGGRPPPEQPSFTLPGFYGRSSGIIALGQGKFAAPRFHFSASLSLGFDDNVFQTPTNGGGTPDRTFDVPVSAAVPAREVQVLVDQSGAVVSLPVRSTQPFVIRTVTVPAIPAVTRRIVVPGIPKQSRQSSLIERVSTFGQVLFGTRRSVFSLDLRLSGENTDAKPQGQPEYSGSIAFQYGYKITPRLQFSARADIARLTQPDFSRPDTPTRLGGGAFYTGLVKVDLAYRWTPRITTDLSLGLNGVSFDNVASQVGNYLATTTGLEVRYLKSPRFTLLGEGRYQFVRYQDNAPVDSHTLFLLVGAETTLSQRLRGSVRIGGSYRTYELSGETSFTPSLEMDLTYRLGRISVLQWSNRYGFEETPEANTKSVSFRSGLTYLHFFGPRLRGTGSINYVHNSSSNNLTSGSINDDSFELTLGFEYSISRRWRATGTYSFSTAFSSNADANYYRNRMFLGLDYEF